VDVLTEKSLSEEDVQWLKELYSYGMLFPVFYFTT
jgi:hypothetical protein